MLQVMKKRGKMRSPKTCHRQLISCFVNRKSDKYNSSSSNYKSNLGYFQQVKFGRLLLCSA